jgi:hypothetical protein
MRVALLDAALDGKSPAYGGSRTPTHVVEDDIGRGNLV